MHAVAEPNRGGCGFLEIGVEPHRAHVLAGATTGAVNGRVFAGDRVAPCDGSLPPRAGLEDALADQPVDVQPHTVPGFGAIGAPTSSGSVNSRWLWPNGPQTRFSLRHCRGIRRRRL